MREDQISLKLKNSLSLRPVREHSLGLVLGLFLILALYITLTKKLNYAFDAKIYTEQAQYYAETVHLGAWQSNSVHYDQSPVLRYTAYAFLLKITGNPDYNTSFRIGLLLTSIIYYVITPYLIFKLIAESSKLKYAWASLGGWFIYQLVGWPSHSIHAGKWQYSYTVALLFGALLLTYRGLCHSDWSKTKKYAIGAGLLLGIAGLTQYTYTLFGIIAITITAALQKKIKFLSIIYVIGGIFILFALIASSPEHFETTLSKTSGSSFGLRSISWLRRIYFSHGIISSHLGGNILRVAVILTGIGIIMSDKSTDTLLLEITGLVVFAFWLLAAFFAFTPGGLGYVNQFVGGILIFIIFGYQTVAIIETIIQNYSNQNIWTNLF